MNRSVDRGSTGINDAGSDSVGQWVFAWGRTLFLNYVVIGGASRLTGIGIKLYESTVLVLVFY